MIRSLSLGTLLLICGLAAQAGPYEDGVMALKAQKYGKAAKLLTAHIKENPNDAAALLARGQAFLGLDFKQKALADFNRAVKLNPKDAAAFTERANAHRVLGEPDQALNDLDRAISLEPNSPASASRYLARGQLRSERYDFEPAIADFDAAIQRDPKLGSAYSGRGLARLELYGIITFDVAGRTFRPSSLEELETIQKSAFADLEKGVELSPKSASSYAARGHARLALRMNSVTVDSREKGREDLAKAIELDPQCSEAYTARAQFRFAALKQFSLYKTADGQVFQKETIKNDPAALREALADADLAVKYGQQRPEGFAVRVKILEASGEFPKAIADYESLCQLKPRDGQIHNDLAWMLATHWNPTVRDGKKAVTFATNACQLQEYKNPYWLDTLAAAYAESGDFAKATETMKAAIGLLDPQAKSNRSSFERRAQLYEQKKPYHQNAPKPAEKSKK